MSSKSHPIPVQASTPVAPRGSLLHMSKSRAAAASPLPVDPVITALQAPVVQTMSPERRAILEADLRAMAASDAPDNLLHEAIEERLRQEAYADELEPLTPEEEAELERRFADADAHPETLIPLEVVLASLRASPSRTLSQPSISSTRSSRH
jgi:hypothetical protein